jgi:hypothetical protein
MELYKEALSQYANREMDSRLVFSKKEKDILLILLQKAEPDSERKMLRKKVIRDVKAIQSKSWKELLATLNEDYGLLK